VVSRDNHIIDFKIPINFHNCVIAMDSIIVWAIIALFYAPLHYLLPMLIVFFRNTDDAELRKQRLVATAIDCTISMVAAFAIVIYLSSQNMLMAMVVLLISMFTPYVRLVLRRSTAVQEA